MEPMSGIEPESVAYHATALPLSYIDKTWCGGRDSNPRRPACKADDLAADLTPQNSMLDAFCMAVGLANIHTRARQTC